MDEENKLSYLQMPLPQGSTSSKVTKTNWSGLNYRQKHDTGALSYENNISTSEAPYLTPSEKRIVYKSGYTKPICMYGFDDFLLVVYNNGAVKIDYINAAGTKYIGTLGGTDESLRSIVQFNAYDTPTDPVSGNYIKKLLVFPDKKSFDFRISADFTPADMNTGLVQVPDIKYAAVHLSRLFGVDDARLFASGFNDYTNWKLDTVDEYNESNAWVSPAQSNTKSNTDFTAITTFQNHVICFKSDYMHELYNNKNPFRVQDIYADGAMDNRSVVDTNGRLVFTSSDGVKVYTGGQPRILSYPLNVSKFTKAVAGTNGAKYYLYCSTPQKQHNLFVYDTVVEQWAQEDIDFEVLSFAKTTTGLYMLGDNGNIYRVDTGVYSHDWSFETDFFMDKTIDIKHIQKIQLFADMTAGAKLTAYLLYDDEVFDAAKSHKIYDYTNSSNDPQKVKIRVIPRMTANYGFKLRVNGFDYARLYHLEIFVRQGGNKHLSD